MLDHRPGSRDVGLLVADGAHPPCLLAVLRLAHRVLHEVMGWLIIVVSAGYSRLAVAAVIFASVPRSDIRSQPGYLGVNRHRR